MNTPEEIARDIADKLPEHPLYDGMIDSGWLVERIAAALASYAAQERAGEREKCAAYLEARARTMGQGEPGSPALWMARIFQDEAAAIRALPETSP